MNETISLTESNQAVVSLFKELVNQSMAVPVAAMNALVLKLKVTITLLLYNSMFNIAYYQFYCLIY